MRGTRCLVLAMLISRKKRKQSDWGFAMEQIGRDLRKTYPPLENLPSRFGVLLMQLERKKFASGSAPTVKDRRKHRNSNGRVGFRIRRRTQCT
jgi:hypothetical protein